MDKDVLVAIIAVVSGLGLGAILRSLVASVNQHRTTKQLADIKETQTAQKALLESQIQDHAQVYATIGHLRAELTAAAAQATLAFAQAADSVKANTELQLRVQRLDIQQSVDRDRISGLEGSVSSLTDVNSGLAKQVTELTRTNVSLTSQVSELTKVNGALQTQVTALSVTNTALQKQIEQLVSIMQDKDKVLSRVVESQNK